MKFLMLDLQRKILIWKSKQNSKLHLLDKTDWRRALAISNKDAKKSFQIFQQAIEKLLSKFSPVTTIYFKKETKSQTKALDSLGQLGL